MTTNVATGGISVFKISVFIIALAGIVSNILSGIMQFFTKGVIFPLVQATAGQLVAADYIIQRSVLMLRDNTLLLSIPKIARENFITSLRHDIAFSFVVMFLFGYLIYCGIKLMFGMSTEEFGGKIFAVIGAIVILSLVHVAYVSAISKFSTEEIQKSNFVPFRGVAQTIMHFKEVILSPAPDGGIAFTDIENIPQQQSQGVVQL